MKTKNPIKTAPKQAELRITGKSTITEFLGGGEGNKVVCLDLKAWKVSGMISHCCLFIINATLRVTSRHWVLGASMQELVECPSLMFPLNLSEKL